MDAKPLTSSMDNVLAWRLGVIVHAIGKTFYSDPIDAGLVLRRMLEENGFKLFGTVAGMPPPDKETGLAKSTE